MHVANATLLRKLYMGHDLSSSEAITSFIAVKLVKKLHKLLQKYLKSEVITFHCSKISNKLLIY